MPTVKVVNMAGAQVGEIELSDAVFGRTVNPTVLHAAVRAYLLNQRQGTHSTLTRAEVSGGGKKPWRQKGPGRARHGSIRSPQWTHGGVALGPKPRSYRTGLNRKVRRAALLGALSAKLASGDLLVVDEIKCEDYSTKTMVGMLKALGAERKALVVLPEVDRVVIKSCDNIPGVKTILYNTLNVYDILNADKFIVSQAAVEKIEEVFA
ncbi:MAG: 50S ribosomal protein L4 [Eubacteriales bacterium]|jgi:large subunit ribosomal protein L4